MMVLVQVRGNVGTAKELPDTVQAVRERTRGQAPSFPRVLFIPFFNLVNI